MLTVLVALGADHWLLVGDCRPLWMLQKQHAGCGVASDDTAEPRTVSCEARAVGGRVARWKSVQVKGEGRGGGPP